MKKEILIVLYIVIQKSDHFLNEKSIKIKKGEHAFKEYASTYNVQILNSFNPELQLKILNLQLKIS